MKSLSFYNKIYFVGIGGISMSSLALIMKSRGKAVLGYDRSRSKETAMLESHGIDIAYEIDNPKLDGVDLVVYTAAVTVNHGIITEAAERGIEIITRAMLLGAIAEGYAISVGIAGTHGKSTTSGMISRIFDLAPGRNPTYAVGAYLPFAGGCYKIGGDESFIFEADEYKDSFLSFKPTTAVVLNVHHDHPDYFKSIQQIISSFGKYISQSEKAVINLDCPNAVKAAENYKGKLYYFSVREKTDFYAENINIDGGYASYDIVYPGGRSRVRLSVPGEHNAANSAAAFAACYINGLTPEEIIKGIGAFTGVARRFEKVGEINGSTVINDYAHHPDEITACLKTAAQVAKGRVITVFQPHTFSRLASLYDAFVASLSLSDIVAVTDVYSARETDDCGVSGRLLAENTHGVYCCGLDGAAEFIKSNAQKNDLVILMGAGDIYKVWELLKNNY
ncbi:MAG: UDP-N-acetylmuramate--L-alanine ligase [Eubacteriales bacterium]|nr:UDP-N-acetylmuramate--L-alanine ligase [Eubacteriales bacterium]